MGNFKLASCVVVMCIALMYAQNGGALSCEQVSGNLVTCLGYLQNGGLVSQRCCKGVKALKSAARTTADRRTTCFCLKSAAFSIKGIKPNYAAALPAKCSVTIPYKIAPSIDCASIKFDEN